MSDRFKLTEIDYLGSMLKIPKGSSHPFQFKISFQNSLTEDEIRKFLADQLKMQIFYPSSTKGDLPIDTIQPIKVGPSDIIFLVDADKLENNTKHTLEKQKKEILEPIINKAADDINKAAAATTADIDAIKNAADAIKNATSADINAINTAAEKIETEAESLPGAAASAIKSLTKEIKTAAEELHENITLIDNFDKLDPIYWGKVVSLDNGTTAKEDTLVDFRFQVVKDGLEKVKISALSHLEQLPNELKNVQVSLKSSARVETSDAALWKLIRDTTTAISFEKYKDFMDIICGKGVFPYDDKRKEELNQLSGKRYLPFTDTDSYRTIKVLTEFFLLINCAAKVQNMRNYQVAVAVDRTDANKGTVNTLPYYKVIRDRFPDLRLKVKGIGDIMDVFADPKNSIRGEDCYGILQDSLTEPCFLELIWSYWQEEAMLVQALNAISLRFQNVRAAGRAKDPLAALEIAPLRPLNNLLWGYIQDEQHRLTVVRRAYEYDHHYGITLQGKAIPDIKSADSRKNFLEAFHMLLYRCILFYKQDDDLTVRADAFPILNSLKEVHYILSEGMHNQYGDLPFTARVEMLSQQWLLARPELREFLPTRAMVAYPEDWMGPLAAMNSIQGWTGTSPTYFNMLAVYGEMLFLAVRFGNWGDTNANSDQATNWAREFRPEIQGYIHAYRTVTGVDLTAPHTQTGKIDSRQPSFHLVQRAKASLNGSSNGNGQVKASSNGKSTVGY